MTPPTPPTPATTPDDDKAGIVSRIRQRAKALLDDGFTTAAESDVIDAPLALRVADHLESLAAARSALAACRAALDGTEGMLWTLSETLDRDEQALPLRRLVDAKRQAIKAALADAERARTEGG
jgi:glutathione S-transferase